MKVKYVENYRRVEDKSKIRYFKVFLVTAILAFVHFNVQFELAYPFVNVECIEDKFSDFIQKIKSLSIICIHSNNNFIIKTVVYWNFLFYYSLIEVYT